MDSRVDQLYEYIRKTDPDVIKENVYICVANGCILLTAYIKSNGEKGWSSRLVDEYDQPILNNEERKALEKTLEKAPWVRNFFTGEDSVQAGGGNVSPVAHNSADKESGDMLDTLFQKIDEMDTYWNEMKTFDTVKQMLDTEQLVPSPFGVPVPVKPRVVVTFLTVLLDFIRLSLAQAGHTNTALTLIVLIEEIVTGQWRQMIMTAAGFISPSGVVAGVIGKYIIISWLAIDSRLRSSIIRNIFKGMKSMVRNMLIWFYATLTPDTVKETMFGFKMPSVPKIPQIPQIPRVISQSGGANTNKITYEYIQDKLKVLDSPGLLCDNEFKDIVAKVQGDPILAAVLAMFNIPTYEKLNVLCVKAKESGATSISEVEDLEDPGEMNMTAVNKTSDPPSAPASDEPPSASDEPPSASVEPPSAPVEPPSAYVEPPSAYVEPPSAYVEPPSASVEPSSASAPVEPVAQKGGRTRRNRKYKRKSRKSRKNRC